MFHLKLDVQGQGGGRISDVDEHGVRGLENWTVSMKVICVPSLKYNCANFHHCKICLRYFREGDLFVASLHP